MVMKMKVLATAFTASLTLGMSGAASAATYDFVYTGAIETWTASATGDYRVTAVGAQGASAQTGREGGRGAEIAGTFSLSAGDMFKILVGGAGAENGTNGGGGGGSFFVSILDDPLLVAGGGGGTRVGALQNGTDASVTEQAYTSSGSGSTYTPTLSGRAAGTGGLATSYSWGSGGAGFFGDGANDSSFGTGGKSWANGMLGGYFRRESRWLWWRRRRCGLRGGGGGGGYTGGDGGWIAGGGGSFNSGFDVFARAGAGIGDGSLSIEYLGDVAPVPVPASLPLLLAGLGGLSFLTRRKRKSA